MSRLIWICAVCKSLLRSPVAVKELNNRLKKENAFALPTDIPSYMSLGEIGKNCLISANIRSHLQIKNVYDFVVILTNLAVP